MGDSPASSDLSDPPSGESEGEDQISNSGGRASRRSIDHSNIDGDQLAPPSKRRKTTLSALVNFDRAPSSSHVEEDDDNISVSSDGFSSVPGSPGDDEYSLRDQAQTQCLWRDCDFGTATNNDELVRHVQTMHCATGGPKKTKYVCEWGECQRKTSNHPSGYALKAHMRSHTKEKPYYCALPECDKAFTRSDALAKHMRTVHEPEPMKGPGNASTTETPPSGKKGAKNRLTNGNAVSPKPPSNPQDLGPTHDEDGNEVDPSPPNDNITYIPAYHPVTGQPGFMIHYPPDITFTAWESSISADRLMRILRRQVHWTEKDTEEIKKDLERLEQQKREEWIQKEILLEGVLEAELAQAEQDDILRKVDARVRQAMKRDVEPAKRYSWAGDETPKFRRAEWSTTKPSQGEQTENADEDDVSMPDISETAHERRHSASPPPTGMSGGFDGDDNPYDNYLQATMAKYEERERIRSTQNTPAKGELAANPDQQAAEADAVGALLDMSGGKT